MSKTSETLILVYSQLLPIEGFVRPGDTGTKKRNDSLTKEVGQGLHDLPWLEESSRNRNLNGHRSRTSWRSFFGFF